MAPAHTRGGIARLRAVLFDSGGVLMQPRGGRWNPPAFFEETVRRFDPDITDDQFVAAFAVGDRFLHESASPVGASS